MRDEFKNLEFSVCETMAITDVLLHIAVTKAAFVDMIQKKSGVIVNISFGSGIISMPTRTLDSALNQVWLKELRKSA